MANSLVVARENKTEAYWISYIRGRIRKKKNFLGMMTGPPGSGKSLGCCSIGEQIDPNFSIKQVVTSARQLLQLINDGAVKPGSCIVWEEAGISQSSREWQSVSNKIINFLLQTFRHKRLILILNVPYIDFIDANSRKLFCAQFETVSIDYAKRTLKVKPLLMQYNPRIKKFYNKFLRIKTPRGVFPLKAWNIPAPSPQLIKDYEVLKENFTSALNKDILSQLDEMEKKKSKDYRQPLTPLQERAMILQAKYNDTEKVAQDMGCVARNVRNHLQLARRKGYVEEEFAEIHD